MVGEAPGRRRAAAPSRCVHLPLPLARLSLPPAAPTALRRAWPRPGHVHAVRGGARAAARTDALDGRPRLPLPAKCSTAATGLHG